MSTDTDVIDLAAQSGHTLSRSTSLPEGHADAVRLETPISYYTDEGGSNKEEEEQLRAYSPTCERRSTNECQPITSSAYGIVIESFLDAARTVAVGGSKRARRELYRTSVNLLQNKQAVHDVGTTQDLVNGVFALREVLNEMTVSKLPTASAHGAVRGYGKLREAAFALASFIDPSFTPNSVNQQEGSQPSPPSMACT